MKNNENPLATLVLLLLLVVSCHINANTKSESEEIDQINYLFDLSLEDLLSIKVGSRRLSGGYTNKSYTPIDVFTQKELDRQRGTNINTMLRTLLPSFNVATQPNMDESAIIRPANFRGLAPDHMMVLLDGKRRHRGSLLSYIGNGVADGAQGVDIESIPSIALKSVQILRDGAAAQYGSDAIAGIINLELQDKSEGGILVAKTMVTSSGDGNLHYIAANAGFSLTENSFINLSAELSEQDRTERQQQRSDAARLALYNADIPNPSQTWGKPDIKGNVKLFYNTALNIDNNTKIYSFGNFSNRIVDTVFYYRTPNGEDRPSRFSNDGGQTLLVGDLNPDNGITCPTINIVNGNPTTSPNYDQISNGGVLDSECFAWTEVRPGGFTPIFSGEVEDSSLLLGGKGEWGQLHWDASTHLGRSKTRLFFNNSMNPSNPNSDPDTEISPGKFIQTEANVNIDLSYPITIGFYSDLVLAVGFEWREESLEVVKGDLDSYTPGVLAGQGFRAAVDGYAGLGPDSAGKFSRDNISLYFEIEADITESWMLGLATRWENFEDFGTTTNFKVGSLFKITEKLGMRATVNSGFRAPTLGQSNIQRTSTQVTATGVKESGILSPGSAITKALSSVVPESALAQLLTPEESKNVSFGFVLEGEESKTSLDFFYLNVTNRISLTPFINTQSPDFTAPEQSAIDSVIAGLVNEGVTGASTIDSFQFFINDFDTVTKGVDLTHEIPVELIDGFRTSLLFSYNYTDTKVKKSTDSLIDSSRIALIENGLPKSRWFVTGLYEGEHWNILARLSYFDDITIISDANSSFDGNYGAKVLFDIDAGFNFKNGLILQLGVENLFNIKPDKYPDPPDFAGQVYPDETPFGFHGAYYYAALKYVF
jgi:iron complex outermembrane receptor protein